MWESTFEQQFWMTLDERTRLMHNQSSDDNVVVRNEQIAVEAIYDLFHTNIDDEGINNMGLGFMDVNDEIVLEAAVDIDNERVPLLATNTEINNNQSPGETDIEKQQVHVIADDEREKREEVQITQLKENGVGSILAFTVKEKNAIAETEKTTGSKRKDNKKQDINNVASDDSNNSGKQKKVKNSNKQKKGNSLHGKKRNNRVQNNIEIVTKKVIGNKFNFVYLLLLILCSVYIAKIE